MSEWQPIETAPKNSTEILALCQPMYGTRYKCLVRWREDFPGWVGSFGLKHVTHWLPVPSFPPEVTSDGE